VSTWDNLWSYRIRSHRFYQKINSHLSCLRVTRTLLVSPQCRTVGWTPLFPVDVSPRPALSALVFRLFILCGYLSICGRQYLASSLVTYEYICHSHNTCKLFSKEITRRVNLFPDRLLYIRDNDIVTLTNGERGSGETGDPKGSLHRHAMVGKSGGGSLVFIQALILTAVTKRTKWLKTLNHEIPVTNI
jgi:hypothetical protein